MRLADEVTGPDSVPTYPSTLSIYKRIANLGMAIAALVVGINLWLSSTDFEQELLQKQANQLGQSLLKQAAGTVAIELADENLDRIEKILNNLAKDPHVHSAALYTAQGELLLQTAGNESLVALYKQVSVPELLVYIENIELNDNIAAYLRLMLKKDKVNEFQKQYQLNSRQQTELLLAIALLAGLLLARTFYKLKYTPSNSKDDTQT